MQKALMKRFQQLTIGAGLYRSAKRAAFPLGRSINSNIASFYYKLLCARSLATEAQNNNNNNPQQTPNESETTANASNNNTNISQKHTQKQSKIIVGEIPIPTPGKSSGDPNLDEATKQWRSLKQKDDEAFKQIFQRIVRTGKKANKDEDDIDPDEDDDDLAEEVRPKLKTHRDYNPETGEHYGPRGEEPTRYGDWELKGRASDF